MEEEYYEEEVLEESDDWLSEIRSSLQDEFLKRRAEKEAMAAKGKNGEVIQINESGHDSVVEYEEEIITGSFVRESMQSQVTVDEIVYESQEEEESADNDDEDHDGGQGDEGYLKSIHSEFHKLFLERKAEKAKAAAASASIPAIDRTSTIEEIVEEHDDEYEEQVIERWVFGGVAPEPEDLKEACRALIPIVYKGENVDPETMIRRTPLPELYRYLKQHYDYKKEVKQDLTDQETQAGEAQTTLESLFKKRAGGDPVLFGGKVGDLNDGATLTSVGDVAKESVDKCQHLSHDNKRILDEGEVIVEETVYESEEEEQGEASTEELGEDGYLKSIHSEFHKLFLERKAEKAKAAAASASIPAIDRTSTIEEIVEEHDDEYEEQVIERWVFGGVAPEPEDLEEACRALIPIVYKGENVDPETMIRRTPLPELYRYLKQHYDYKKEVKQDLTDQETQAGEAQTTLESLFKKRAGGDPVLFGGKTSDLKDSSPQGEFAKKTTTVNENAGRGQRDSIVYEEVFLESTTDLDASGALLMGESERSFEEIVERSYSEEMVEIEETIHEEDDPQGSDLDEDEAYIVEETIREESDESVVEEEM